MHRNIFSIPDVSTVASAIADPSRAKILFALINTDGIPAGALAAAAGIKPQTASSHLKILERARLVMSHQIGRHRYYRIASEDAADVIEALARFSPPHKIMTSRDSLELGLLRSCRTCYGHLAGRLGVELFETLKNKKLLHGTSPELRLNRKGLAFFETAQIESDDLAGANGKECLDWTQRQYHLGGTLGKAIAGALLAGGYLRRSNEGRAVRPTRRTSQFCQTFRITELT